MAEKGIFNMQNFGYDKAVFGSKYRVFASKNDYNHWLLSLSVRFCPNPQATPNKRRARIRCTGGLFPLPWRRSFQGVLRRLLFLILPARPFRL